MPINLRDALLAALSTLPGTRIFHVHSLISAPRKHAALFPFAKPRPRTYLQDILVLVSEQATPDSPHILVVAVEACLYHILSSSSGILYVSKVDTTGQGAHPSPTSTLVRTLLLYFADPTTRPIPVNNFWIQLFARAQAQYLFANSSEFPGKRPLSDVKLCSWWRQVLTDVAEHLQAMENTFLKFKAFYLLPGFDESDATVSLRVTRQSSATVIWQYGHPYSQTEIPLPCPKNTTPTSNHLGHYIPSYDDDPKSRFIDELAYTTEARIKSPVRKRSRISQTDDSDTKEKQIDKQATEGDGDYDALGDLPKVTADEFWERMSFRQECVAGAVTGFFTLAMTSKLILPEGGDASAASPLTPRAEQVPSQINKRIITSLLTGVEFSTVERAIKATESLENAIKGLCEGKTPIYAQSNATNVHIVRAVPEDATSGRRTPERGSSNQVTYLGPSQTPPRVTHGKRMGVDVSPSPFPEPVTSLETYELFIYGSVGIDNPGLSPRTQVQFTSKIGQDDTEMGSGKHVTVLTARKKKKRSA